MFTNYITKFIYLIIYKVYCTYDTIFFILKLILLFCIFVYLDDLGNIYLASGSQDSVIRLWKFTIEENDISKSNKELENSLKLESKNFTVTKTDGSIGSYMIQLETVITGHDGWIYGVHWRPKICTGIFQLKQLF